MKTTKIVAAIVISLVLTGISVKVTQRFNKLENKIKLLTRNNNIRVGNSKIIKKRFDSHKHRWITGKVVIK